ncbi:FAD-dependent oxidoreductase [Streptomyces iconiensis]|uniref:FAD-dependent oxidoreductase n=1 Tax=Streptomyces iconiensis TaxID=1384038 RepID=A0ABT6ZWZ7_9ACTN|nr:FAD-dependent oxidoreductase [Streptomyces iconiensis]MDJ1133591.1 FAD-dependent oxidoreductase [Streptomyces iconiensis]
MAAAERMVVIGGDATGMSAASQARRLKKPEELEIVAFERGHFASFSACGIPYWVGGDVTGRDNLIARTPEEHRARSIDLRMHTEVTELDVPGQRVRVTEHEDGGPGTQRWVGYDQLVLATGARPVRPPLPGIEAPGVYGVQTLDDGQALIDALEKNEDLAGEGAPGGGDGVRRAVVVGAGYIGVEMAEAFVNRGYQVTVIDRGQQPMSTLDPDMGALVYDAMCAMGIETVRNASVTRILTDARGRAAGVATDDGEYPADVVVLGLGVRPETELAAAAGLPLGESGGLLTDLAMRVRDHGNIWSGGDCVEVLNLVSGRPQHVPLGTHANKHGQIIGANIGGDYATFPGIVGTAVSKVCDLEIARTGLLERQAAAVGLQFETVVIESTSRAGYYPGTKPMHVKMIAERRSGRVLGVQIVGRENAGKRVDIAAVALHAGMTAEQMTGLDLGYAPPFSPVWDPVLVAARKASAAVRAARPN